MNKPNYSVLPLPRIQREAKKLLTRHQLQEGIELAKSLRFYPNVPDLSIEPCGEGLELRIETPEINKQGWLRAIFWIHEKNRTIYIMDLFWKKTTKVSIADIHRANHRIRLLNIKGAADLATKEHKSHKIRRLCIRTSIKLIHRLGE